MKQGDRFGRFEILDDLGAGGMGEVYRARDTDDNEFVALKLLHSQRVTNPAVVARFVREAEIYRRLRHPNIVSYVGSGVQDGVYFLAVELVKGTTLDGLIEKAGGPLDLKNATIVAIDILEALAYTHRHEVVHRDLKPGNVMVSRKGEVKLLDFGVAAADDALVETRCGDLLGSYLWSAPEQNKGLPVDHRADLYSFGLLLYYLVTGKPAFKGTLIEVRKRQDAEEFHSPSSRNKKLPPALDSICRHLMRAALKDRVQSAEEALEELRDFQDMAGLG
jgi:serine/threonine-protein kinase